jgi:SanA protein
MRKYLNFLVFFIFSGVLAVLVLQFHINRFSSEHIHSDKLQLQPAYTGIVLGASVRPDKSLSPILQDRVDSALELYEQGVIKRFLLSGDHGNKNYDEVNAMKNYLNKKGVPDRDIFLDHAGFDTYNSMIRARDVFMVRDAIVITQEFHLPRAVYLGNKLGLDVQGYVADKRTYARNDNYKRREWLANIKAWIELNIEQQPTFSGRQIPINGDSRLSHDQ